PGRRPAQAPVSAEVFEQPQRQRDEAVLVSLALADVNDHPGAVDIANLQGEQLAEAQTAAVGDLQEYAVTPMGSRLDEARDCVWAEDAGQGVGAFAVGDVRHVLGPAEGEAVQEAQGGDDLVEPTPGDAALKKMELKGTKVFGSEQVRGPAKVLGEANHT